MPESTQQAPHPNFSMRKSIIVLTATFLCVTGIALYISFLTGAPHSTSDTFSFEVTPGMSVRDIADAAEEQNVVRSSLFLYSILTYSYDPTDIYAGTYIFSQPTSVFNVARKLANKEIENSVTRITIPEGVSVKTIARIASATLTDFDTETYIEQATPQEGYLFPETYFIPEDYTAGDLLNLQKKTYTEKVAPLQNKIEEKNISEYELLILASIVEREANDEASMKMVAGILQNRLDINMPLQADASIEYTLDKPLSELTAADLKINSPYNTYLNTGLPPTPIGNPGLMAITAVLEPTPSDNFFYITAPDGTFHYAKTFAEHNRNIDKYLR